MKRFIFMFILFMCLISVHAETQTLTVNVKVPKTEPTYLLMGSLEEASGYVTTSLTSETDISTTDIPVYVKLYQTNRARVKKTYTLSLSADALKMDNDNITDAPTIEQLSKATSTNNLQITGDGAELTLVYVTGKPTKPHISQNNDGEIAIYKVTYPHKDELALGDYSSTITFTFTTQ